MKPQSRILMNACVNKSFLLTTFSHRNLMSAGLVNVHTYRCEQCRKKTLRSSQDSNLGPASELWSDALTNSVTGALAFRCEQECNTLQTSTMALLLSQPGFRSDLRASNFLGEHASRPPLLFMLIWMHTCTSDIYVTPLPKSKLQIWKQILIRERTVK